MDYPKVDRPTVPGWYWFEGATRPAIWTILRVFRDGYGDIWVEETTNNETLLVEFQRGEWRGPILEPKP